MPQGQPPRYPFSTNFEEVLVTVLQVEPENYIENNPEHWIDEGRVVRSETIKVKVNEFREVKEIVLDLQEWLQHPKEGLGQVYW